MSDMDYLSAWIPLVLDDFDKRDRQSLHFNDPVLWAKDYLGVQMWSRQAEVAMSVVENRNTAVKAGHEVGKSWLAGVLICWWIDTRAHLEGGAFVVSTAPSFSQINAVVWKEIRRFRGMAEQRFADGLIDHVLPGYVTSDAHWRLENGIEIGYGRKPPDAKEDTMSGIHARFVLSIGDEAVGLSEKLIDDLGNLTSNATSRRIIIANPTNPLSYMARLFKMQSKAWAFHTISVFDSPNFHGGEGLPQAVLETLVDQSYVDDRLEDWGSVENPKYIARVLGEFAFDQGPTIISSEDMGVGLDAAIEPSSEGRPVLGVDVSRSEHGDMNTVYRNDNGKLRFVDAWNEKNAMRTAERIVKLAVECGAAEVRIDSAGLGGPIMDRVVELALGKFITIPMLGGAPSPDRSKYFNSRAFWYSDFAEKLRTGKIDVDPADDKLQEELMGIEYKQQTHGLGSLLIESKDDMRKRGVGSPDYADSAIYAMASVGYVYGPQDGDKVRKTPDQIMLELELSGFRDPYTF